MQSGPQGRIGHAKLAVSLAMRRSRGVVCSWRDGVVQDYMVEVGEGMR